MQVLAPTVDLHVSPSRVRAEVGAWGSREEVEAVLAVSFNAARNRPEILAVGEEMIARMRAAIAEGRLAARIRGAREVSWYADLPARSEPRPARVLPSRRDVMDVIIVRPLELETWSPLGISALVFHAAALARAGGSGLRGLLALVPGARPLVRAHVEGFGGRHLRELLDVLALEFGARNLRVADVGR